MKNVIFAMLVSLGLTGGVALAEGTPLGAQMEKIDDAYKAIKKADDAAAGVKESRDGQAAILKALTLLPEMVAKMPDGPAKDKAVAGYKQQMGGLFVVFCQAEVMFLNGETGEEKIDALVDAFKAAKKKGHGQFIEEEE